MARKKPRGRLVHQRAMSSAELPSTRSTTVRRSRSATLHLADTVGRVDQRLAVVAHRAHHRPPREAVLAGDRGHRTCQLPDLAGHLHSRSHPHQEPRSRGLALFGPRSVPAPGLRQRQRRFRQISRTGRPRQGRSRSWTGIRSWASARPPHARQNTVSPASVSTTTLNSVGSSDTAITRKPSRPSNASESPESSVTVGGSRHWVLHTPMMADSRPFAVLRPRYAATPHSSAKRHQVALRLHWTDQLGAESKGVGCVRAQPSDCHHFTDGSTVSPDDP